MTTLRRLATVALASLAVAAPVAAQEDELREPWTVAADGRIELFCALARLAGFEEYRDGVPRSPYTDALDARLAPLEDHAAVALLRELRGRAGIGYDAVVMLAVHLTPLPGLAERFDLDAHRGRLDDRWTPADARELARLARDFAREAGFQAFLVEHDALLRSAEARLETALAGRLDAAWFEEHLGAKPDLTVRLVPALLAGRNNYGVGVRFPDGSEELSPAIGAYRLDDEGIPVWPDAILSTVVHELAHSWANPLVAAHADRLDALEGALFPRVRAVMQDQAYGTWRSVLNETLTRACVVRWVLAHDGAEAARAQAEQEVQRGFAWSVELARLLGELEADRERRTDLAAAMPRIVEHLEALATRERGLAPRRPGVRSMRPANGADGVDPGTGALVVVFDRPMRAGSWSIVGPGAPEIAGEPAFDGARTTLTVPIRLEPDRRYLFFLNGATYTGFQSADGVPMNPVRVAFTTRAK